MELVPLPGSLTLGYSITHSLNGKRNRQWAELGQCGEGEEGVVGKGVARVCCLWYGQLNATNRRPLTANDTFMPL